MLSVGIFTYSTQPRGSVVHAMCLAEALVASGHDAMLYALSKPGGGLCRPVACPVELVPAAAAPPAADEVIRQRIAEFVAGFGRLGRHDILHAQDCLAANALLAHRATVPDLGPIVRTVHHVEHFESPYLADCQRKSICDADGLLSVSAATQAKVREEFDRPSLLVTNGVDHGRFRNRRTDVDEVLRRRCGVEPGDVVVLSVGGVEPRKNTLTALGAVAATCTSVPRVRWIIAGDHSLWDHSAYVSTFEGALMRCSPEIRRRVVRLGTLPDAEMASLYAISDILLCPSQLEGFGLCVLEAMATGAAVIAPGRAPFTEYLDGGCAVFVDPDSPASVTGALESLAVDPDRRHKLGAAGRLRSGQFTWSRSAQLHVAHYTTLLSAYRKPN